MMMRGEQAHCGFPELAYGRYAEVLCSKGFRVARVEQTESPEENAARKKTAPKGMSKIEAAIFKATRREICSVLSRGTRTFNHFDTMNHSDNQPDQRRKVEEFLREVNYEPPSSTVLVAIKEIPLSASDTPSDGELPSACE